MVNASKMSKFQSKLIIIAVLSIACFVLYLYVHPAFKDPDYSKSSSFKLQVETVTESIQTMSSKVMNDKEKVLAAARRVTVNGNTLLVSFINYAYLPFAYSWLCNTKGMNIHHKVLIIASDEETEKDLKKKRPEIETVSISGFKINGPQRYTRAGYVRIGIKRTEVLNWILQDNIGIFLFEFDCLWVKNPVPEMIKYVDHDLVITPVAERPGMVAIGFYYMAPTDRMKKLWQELTRRLLLLDARLQKLSPGTVISEGDNDQLYLTALLNKKYANVRVKLLSLKEYPDGKWYELPAAKRRDISKIYILNNNWVEGNQNKIKRAEKWGHWFVTEDNNTCDMEKVNKIVQLS
ncbi:hypothetical protein FSP39_000215 [Pinctada imbricata]|uniref:Nucleotide-diphospho-sugar transferase domain-containing protein n=1 Tax=Pinctada imbricata TaxID=66713 RepID=A0AA88XDY4_PINIB|nr:hypothetical protein FSP39_000215 [Pinctada imbricata]